MDLSCIISSGELELYVLGTLPLDEAIKIEQLMLMFPEVREEVDRIAETMEALANQSTLAPRIEVRNNLFKTFHGLSTIEKTNSPVMSPGTSEQSYPLTPAKIVSLKKYSYLAAASVILLVISIGIILVLINDRQQKNITIATLTRKVELGNSNSRQQSIAYNQILNILQDKDYQQIRLLSLPGKPQATVNVFWNKKTSDVYLVDVSLPAPPTQKQYQLWAIVNGKPVNAGMLSGTHTTEKMISFPKVDAFAITLENTGGSEKPTLDQMYVMGKT